MSAVPKPDRAADDVRFYLKAWRRWVRGWRAPLGYPSVCAFVRAMRPTVDPERQDFEEEVDQWILRAVDAEVESLSPMKRAAVRLIYLNEILPAVFRSARAGVSNLEECRRLASEAELEMVPRLRLRGVVLGGA